MYTFKYMTRCLKMDSVVSCFVDTHSLFVIFGDVFILKWVF